MPVGFTSLAKELKCSRLGGEHLARPALGMCPVQGQELGCSMFPDTHSYFQHGPRAPVQQIPISWTL